MSSESAPPRRSTPATPGSPVGYGEVLERLKREVRTARARAQQAVTTELLDLYRTIGAEILAQQEAHGWGARVIARLATDLKHAFPDMRGFSRSNLYYMRAFATAWPLPGVVPPSVGQLPWRHIRCLIDKLDTQDEREWYAAHAVAHGWSLPVLEHQIATGLRGRAGAAPSNFSDRLVTPESGLAQQLVRDPYVFEFLDLRERAAERDMNRR